jgi:hypothetical protein
MSGILLQKERMVQRWKWCPGVVETYSRAVEKGCRSGGNGMPERWKNEKRHSRLSPFPSPFPLLKGQKSMDFFCDFLLTLPGFCGIYISSVVWYFHDIRFIFKPARVYFAHSITWQRI